MRIAWSGGETRLSVGGPPELLVQDDDLSAFVPISLLLAMRREEPLEIDGPVSAKLLDALPETQDILSAWAPTLMRVPVRVSEIAPVEPRGAGRATCFSRGVDSMYSAARPRREGEELTHLVYCDGFDPSYGPATSAARIEAARGAAAAIGVPLAVATTNLPEVIHHVVDFEDSYGPALAMVGLALGAGIGTLGIPSSRGYTSLMPSSSHPLLDPRWSSERAAIEHDGILERIEKVQWLVDHRPDLLPWLYVCYDVDTAANCGDCLKCLNTALLLEIAGGLEQAGSLPPTLDMERVRKGVRFGSLVGRLGANVNYQSLSPGSEHDEFRSAIEEILRRSTAMPIDESPHGILRHQNRLFRAMHEGSPYGPVASGPRSPEVSVAALPPLPPPAGESRPRRGPWPFRRWHG